MDLLQGRRPKGGRRNSKPGSSLLRQATSRFSCFTSANDRYAPRAQNYHKIANPQSENSSRSINCHCEGPQLFFTVYGGGFFFPGSPRPWPKRFLQRLSQALAFLSSSRRKRFASAIYQLARALKNSASSKRPLSAMKGQANAMPEWLHKRRDAFDCISAFVCSGVAAGQNGQYSEQPGGFAGSSSSNCSEMSEHSEA